MMDLPSEQTLSVRSIAAAVVLQAQGVHLYATDVPPSAYPFLPGSELGSEI